MYLIFSFLRFAVTYRRWKCICFSIFRGLQSLTGVGNVSAFLFFAVYSHFLAPNLYLLFSFFRFAVTSRRQKCICFSPFRDLQSLFITRSVSYFPLLAICGHFRKLGVIFFSPFSDLQSLWKPGSVSFFLFLAICGHFRIHECICILLFCNLRSLLVPGIVSYFLLLVICSHILTPEMYLLFYFSRFTVTYRRQKAMSKAW